MNISLFRFVVHVWQHCKIHSYILQIEIQPFAYLTPFAVVEG